MSLLLFLAVLSAAMYWVIKTLAPEMAKPSLPRTPKPIYLDIPSSEEPDERLRKLETLLAEKNHNISLLQMELKVFHIQVREFDKVKSLLDEEILRLREQNRIFRSELGLPTVQPKENSKELFL